MYTEVMDASTDQDDGPLSAPGCGTGMLHEYHCAISWCGIGRKRHYPRQTLRAAQTHTRIAYPATDAVPVAIPHTVAHAHAHAQPHTHAQSDTQPNAQLHTPSDAPSGIKLIIDPDAKHDLATEPSGTTAHGR